MDNQKQNPNPQRRWTPGKQVSGNRTVRSQVASKSAKAKEKQKEILDVGISIAGNNLMMVVQDEKWFVGVSCDDNKLFLKVTSLQQIKDYFGCPTHWMGWPLVVKQGTKKYKQLRGGIGKQTYIKGSN